MPGPGAERQESDASARESRPPGVAPEALSALLEEVFRRPLDAEVEPSVRFAPGQVVGRFDLLREIGRGGFGVVFEARDRELGGRSRSRRCGPARKR